MSRSIQSFSLSILALLCALPMTAAAAFDLVTFATTPKTPSANESVLVRMVSYAVDLNSSKIIWYVNKEPVKEGVGETSLTLRTGNFGEKTTIDVVIVTTEGAALNKQFIIAPGEVDVLWEAQTYTPPFYKGKALPTYKSFVRVTAIPRFNSLTSNPADYSYKWTYNRTLGAGEGLGKNSILIPVGYAGTPLPINIDVRLPGTDWKGAKYMTIPVSTAKVVFYEQAPLLGTLYHHALSSTAQTTGTEYTMHAAPYFFSLDDLYRGNLLLKWSIDNRYQAAGPDPLNVTLVKAGEKAERHSVSLSIQNPQRILQEGHTQSTVSFSALQ
jgi:hypothetical protein